MSKNFCIARVGKLKSFSKISAASNHNDRTADVPNADPGKNHYTLLGKGKNAADLVRDRIEKAGITPRKNSVLANEIVLTMSPDAKVNLKQWAKDNLKFLQDRYGKNVVHIALHNDETTPHIHAIVTPIMKKENGKEGYKLSARDYTGGPGNLTALQDDYAEAMAKHGLERGVRKSKAKHQSLKEFYSKGLDQANQALSSLRKLQENLPEISWVNPKKAFNDLLDRFGKVAAIADQVPTLKVKLDNSEKDVAGLREACGALSAENAKLRGVIGQVPLEDAERVLRAFSEECAERCGRQAQAQEEALQARRELYSDAQSPGQRAGLTPDTNDPTACDKPRRRRSRPRNTPANEAPAL